MNHFSNYEEMKKKLFCSNGETGARTDDVSYNGSDYKDGMISENQMIPQRSTDIPTTPVAPEGGYPVESGPGSNIPTTPIAPEGGYPVAPGPGSNIPTIPIAPEGGYPVAPGPGSNIPTTPIAPEGGYPPVAPGPGSNIPTTPIAPEGGYPVAPGPGGITVLPPTVINFANVRVFHAASNYVPIRATIGNRTVADNLAFGTVSNYSRITDGFRTVTIYSTVSNVVLLRTTLPFTAGSKITLAVVNTANGLEIVTISDTSCRNVMSNRGCLRAVNITYDDGPFDIILSDGRIVFSDVRTKEVTPWKQAIPGEYEFYIMETPYGVMPIDSNGRLEETPYIAQGRYMDASYLLNFYVRIAAGKMYTAYIIGGYYSVTPLQVVVIEN